MNGTLTTEKPKTPAQKNYFKNHEKLLDTPVNRWYSSYNENTQESDRNGRGKEDFMRISSMIIGRIYPIIEVTNPKALANACPCCGKRIEKHARVIACHAPDKGAQNYTAICGVGCKPEHDHVESESLKFRLAVENRELGIADIAYACRKMDVEIKERDNKGRFIRLEIDIYPHGRANAIGKLGRCLSEMSALPIEQSVDGGLTWTELDTTVYAKVFGCGKYQGRKAYGV